MEEQAKYQVQVVNFDEYAMTADRVRKQVNLIQEVMRDVMHVNEHYGVIPGCGTKPTLLKPGAEKLSTTFRLAPSYDIRKSDLPNGHREYEIVCSLTHMSTGQFVGQGLGSCSTMEGKYRFRKAAAKCPECGKEDTIIKGKQEFGGGWLCFKKKGGCGAKFADGDGQIENQEMGRVEHDNPADYYNTVLKMAKKRAQVDAVLTATAASDIFTQDIEDMPEVIVGARTEPTTEQPVTPLKPINEPEQKNGPRNIDKLNRTQKAKVDWLCGQKKMTEGEANALLNFYLGGYEPTKESVQKFIDGFGEVYDTYMDSLKRKETK